MKSTSKYKYFFLWKYIFEGIKGGENLKNYSTSVEKSKLTLAEVALYVTF